MQFFAKWCFSLIKIPEIIKNDNSMNEQIRKIRSETVYNIGNSVKIGSEIIEKMYNEANKLNS